MIVSHRHRFVFLKTRKTAGTSIEIALSRHCGPQDVITPISPEDELIRQQVSGRGPQNYQGRLDGGCDAYNHMFAKRVRDLVGDQVWDSYFTFAVERDPWDTVISAFNHHRAQPHEEQQLTLSEFVAQRCDKLARNSRIYRISGRVAVDKVCRYERLDADLDEVCARVGLPALELPRAKGGSPRAATRDDLAHEQVERIGELFDGTIRYLGYRWQQPTPSGGLTRDG